MSGNVSGPRERLMGRGDAAEVRLTHQGVINVRVSNDGTALLITAAPGWLLEDPEGNRLKTTEFVVVPRE